MKIKIDKKLALDMYKRMQLCRKFEEKVVELVNANEIYGTTHEYIGQEAVAIGICLALKPGDYIMSTHRGHGHMIAKGGELKYMFAELMGKSSGYNCGKGGSMHIAEPEIGILGANGIVGGGAGHMRRLAGDDGAASGHADRGRRECLCEGRALGHQSIQYRRFDDRVAHRGDGVVTLLVREKEENVGLAGAPQYLASCRIFDTVSPTPGSCSLIEARNLERSGNGFGSITCCTGGSICATALPRRVIVISLPAST